MGNCLCCAVIEESSLGIVEEFGKFSRILPPGFHCLNCFFESVAYRPSLILQQFTTNVETVTKDRISVTIKVGVQYKINHENIVPHMIHTESINDKENTCTSISTKSRKVDEYIPLLDPLSRGVSVSYQNAIIPTPSTDTNPIYQATYKTRNPTGQMVQFIDAYFRGISCDHTMNDLFMSKSTFSDTLTNILNKEMHSYGFLINRVLIMDIDPPVNVKNAMNLVSESVSKREATVNNAEADKVAKILRAEADSEVRRLEGEGLAKQRQALVEGLKHSVTGICGNSIQMDPQQLTSTIVTMQYIDMIDRIGSKGHHTFILSAAPDAGKSFEEQVRTAILSTKGDTPSSHKILVDTPEKNDITI